MARYNQVVDLPRDDLKSLLAGAEHESHRRRLGEIRCTDIMSSDVVAVEFGTPMQEAWALIRQRRIKALPVVDRSRRVVGIVTVADFLRGADLEVHDGFDERLRRLIRASPASHSDKAEVVGQIMTRQVRVASAERSLAELVPIFSSTGHHHIPVIDADARLVGILTQSDLVRALIQENAG
jgi:CBS domain-containing membrane protein